jgi:type II secretory pathway component GspD/PulD (secretin)
MWGNPNHCAELARIARETHLGASTEGVELEVLIAETNRAESTHDGIDWGGERVAKEVRASSSAGDEVG